MTTLDPQLEQYNLDRKAASRLLKVSIRTIDRYIKDKKLSTSVVDGRVWLDRAEVGQFKDQKEEKRKVGNVDMSTPKMSIDNGVDSQVDNVDKIEVINRDNVSTVSTRKKKTTENKVYKELYTQAKEELNEKQERLEIANYRVGQLEAQLKNTIPILEYHKESFEKKKKQDELKEKITQQNTVIKRIKTHLKSATFNKRVFLIILLALLALQPLWLLLIYR